MELTESNKKNIRDKIRRLFREGVSLDVPLETDPEVAADTVDTVEDTTEGTICINVDLLKALLDYCVGEEIEEFSDETASLEDLDEADTLDSEEDLSDLESLEDNRVPTQTIVDRLVAISSENEGQPIDMTSFDEVTSNDEDGGEEIEGGGEGDEAIDLKNNEPEGSVSDTIEDEAEGEDIEKNEV